MRNKIFLTFDRERKRERQTCFRFKLASEDWRLFRAWLSKNNVFWKTNEKRKTIRSDDDICLTKGIIENARLESGSQVQCERIGQFFKCFWKQILWKSSLNISWLFGLFWNNHILIKNSNSNYLWNFYKHRATFYSNTCSHWLW